MDGEFGSARKGVNRKKQDTGDDADDYVESDLHGPNLLQEANLRSTRDKLIQSGARELNYRRAAGTRSLSQGRDTASPAPHALSGRSPLVMSWRTTSPNRTSPGTRA
jgi:hypothetical protein